MRTHTESPEGEPTYLSQISLGQRQNPDSTVWHTLEGEFVITGWEIPPGHRLRVDWTSINETFPNNNLWSIPYWNSDGRLTLGLDSQHPAYIQIPILSQENTGILSNEKLESDLSPHSFQLAQNSPNPFNPSTSIRFHIPKRSRVILDIYNLIGNKIATLVNENLDAGVYHKTFNADRLAGGVYFYRLQTGKQIFTKKMILLR